MNSQFIIVNSQSKKESFKKLSEDINAEHGYVYWEYTFGNPRTGLQNAALHVYCRLVAEQLNEMGLTLVIQSEKKPFKEGFSVKWTSDMVKENIWRPVQKAVLGFSETSRCKTTDYAQVYDVINLKLSDFGIHVPWPQKEK